MTKPGAVLTWFGGNDVADLDLAIADDDAGYQALDQLPLLLPGRLRQTLPHVATELLHARSKETAIGRYKHLIGPNLRARNLPGQQGEVALAVQALIRIPGD